MLSEFFGNRLMLSYSCGYSAKWNVMRANAMVQSAPNKKKIQPNTNPCRILKKKHLCVKKCFKFCFVELGQVFSMVFILLFGFCDLFLYFFAPLFRDIVFISCFYQIFACFVSKNAKIFFDKKKKRKENIQNEYLQRASNNEPTT